MDHGPWTVGTIESVSLLHRPCISAPDRIMQLNGRAGAIQSTVQKHKGTIVAAEGRRMYDVLHGCFRSTMSATREDRMMNTQVSIASEMVVAQFQRDFLDTLRSVR